MGGQVTTELDEITEPRDDDLDFELVDVQLTGGPGYIELHGRLRIYAEYAGPVRVDCTLVDGVRVAPGALVKLMVEPGTIWLPVHASMPIPAAGRYQLHTSVRTNGEAVAETTGPFVRVDP